MNEFFRRPSPPSSAREMHHDDSIADETTPPLHHPNFNLGWRRRNNRNNAHNKSINPDELSVTHLRRVYSTLLEEMAPSVHGTPNGKHYRWKNSGTVTMEGDDNEGYEYCYTPDNSQKSWRLNHAAWPGMNDGRGKGSATNSTDKIGAVGGGMIGITGGDWSIDGIRRYHTGGSILVVEPPKYHPQEDGAAATKEEIGRDDNNERSSNILRVGSMDVDVGLMNGVELSPVKLSVETTDNSDGEVGLQSDLTIDDNDAIDGTTNDLHENSSPDLEQRDNELPEEQEYHDAQLSSVVESYATTSSNQNTAIPNASFDKSTNLFDNGLISLNSASNSNSNTMTAFESLYHLSPSMAWRLRSAYAPTTPQEEHFMSVGSEILTQRHPDKADGIMRGLAMTRQCESRVCDGLRKIGELISYCERIKGSRNLSSSSTPSRMTGKEAPPTDTNYTYGEDDREEFDEEDIEVAEAMFGYFCEKNVLPMLIDSLLCHPPAMTPSDNIGNATPSNSNIMNTLESSPHSPSPFSGVNWTASVKSQILQTIAMILFNTSSPLSLTYLLSNNYMNELIMGMLPLDRWRADALEEILPPYVTLLRGLVMRLRGDEGKCCLPLFLCQRKRRNIPSKDNDNMNENDAIATTETYLPLLYAAVQVFCSSYGTSLRDSEGCLIRTTAMNVILNLARISDPEMRMVLVVGGGDAVDGSELPTTKFTPTPSPLAGSASLMSSPLTLEQELLFPHICNSLNSWFHRSVRLVMASLSVDEKSKHHEAKLEAKARHKDIAEVQFRELQYWLGFLDDLLSCDIRIWNARLVECILRDVVVGTVLSRWNRSLDVIERNRNDRIKSLPEIYKAHAEIRVSIVFLTQLFGMVEYSPLVRLVGTLVLHPSYPSQWCCLDNDAGGSDGSAKGDGSFVITTAINSMINDATATSVKGEEADAGAGRQPNVSSETISKFQEPDDCRALESGDLDHAPRELSENLDQIGSSNNQLIPSRHRAAILDMLGGRYSSDETILVSMLLATILENEAINDVALEIFGVLPSPVNDDGNSPFELSMATYLTKDWSKVDSKSYLALGSAIESVSTLGFMLLERLIFHTWTEGGQCTDVIPFHHYFKASAYVEAVGSCLTHFVSRAQTHLHDASSIREIFSDSVRQRYSRIDENNSPRTRKDSVKLVCFLQSYYPSNFIDNLSVLTGDMIYGGSSNENISQGDLFLFNDDNEAAKFAVRVTLHLRSILGCIQDFYQRFSFDSGSPWYSGGEAFAFSTTETADEILMSIGGIESIPLPNVGTDIDLRGRKFFLCSLPTKSKHGHIGNTGMIIGANGSKIAVTEKTDLVLIVDALHIFVAKEKRDYNRCTVLSVIPVRTIVASATEGEMFHIVCHTNETFEKQGDMVKDGRLSLRFGRGDTCVSVKECVDKHCIAFENKVMLDMADMLEKCSLIGSGTNLHSSLQSIDIDDSWNDFQHA